MRARSRCRRVCATAVALAIAASAVALIPGSPASATDNTSPRFDRDADSTGDFALIRPTSETAYTWFWMTSTSFAEDIFGNPNENDFPLVGDFDGDGIDDPAVYRSGSPSHWLVLLSTAPGATLDVPFGKEGDVPLTGDIDGDGRTDFVVWRPGSPSEWFVQTAVGTFGHVVFGDSDLNDDSPALGDMDGDGRADLLIRRAAAEETTAQTTTFHIRTATGNFPTPILFGEMDDVYVPGDYNNDAIGDIAVVRVVGGNYQWFFRLSDGTFQNLLFGSDDASDVLVQSDYDGDGYTDAAVWRPGNPGVLFIQPLQGGAAVQTPFGNASLDDWPLEFFFNCMQNLPTLCAP